MKGLSHTVHTPYVGLRPFEERDSLLFFGRTRNIEELLARFDAAPISTPDATVPGAAMRFVAVLGASGTGKSSLVRAGLIPALHRGGTRLPSTRRWNVITFKPGNAPMVNLTEALARLGPVVGDFDTLPARQFLAARLGTSPLGLVEQWQESLDRHRDEALLVFVDQFEEIFRYRQTDLNEAESFVKLLLRSATVPDVPIYVVITMRADFLDQAVAFRQLPDAINYGLYLTPRLDVEELRSVVTAPLRLIGGSIQPELVARLLNDLGGEDELPVLQHALLRMWIRAHAQDRANILMDDYRAVCAQNDSTGKVNAGEPRLQASIDNHATEILNSLTEDGDDRIARELFLSLVDRSDNRLVRRERTWAELLERFEPGDEVGCKRVLDAYRADGVGFLLPHQGTAIASATVVDIAHESLFRQWQYLQQWLSQEANDVESLRIYLTRALRHATEGGGWLDEQDTVKALAWVTAMEQRGAPDRWAARYQPRPDAVTMVKRYASGSADDLDRRKAGQAQRDREMAVLKEVNARRTKKAAVALGVAFLFSSVLLLSTVVSEKKAVEARNVAEQAKLEAVVAKNEAVREKVAADNAKVTALKEKAAADAAKVTALREKSAADEARDAAVGARRAQEIAARSALAAQKEADLQREVATFQGIWGPLLFLGENNEANYAPLGLLYLARADVGAKQFALQRLLNEPKHAAKFNENPIAILRGAVGISPEMHRWLLATVRNASRSPEPAVTRARALAMTYLDKPGFEAVLDELKDTKRPARIKILSDELVDLSQAEPSKAGERITPLLNVIKSTQNAEMMRSQLYRTLDVLSAHLTPLLATEVATTIVNLPPRPLGYERTFRRCAALMSDAERTKILAGIIPKLNGSGPDQRSHTIQASIIVTSMETQVAPTEFVTEKVLAALMGTVIPSELASILEGAAGMLSRIGTPAADKLLPKFVDKFVESDDEDQRNALAPNIERLAQLASANVVRQQLSAFNQSPDPSSSLNVDRVFEALSKHVSRTEADAIVTRLLDAPKFKTGAPQWSLAERTLLVRMLRRTSPAVVDRAASVLNDALETPPALAAVPLATALGKSALSSKAALASMRTALNQLTPESSPDTQRTVSTVVIHLSRRMDPASARELTREISPRMNKLRSSEVGKDGPAKGFYPLAEALLAVASVGAESEWDEAPGVLKLFFDTPEGRSLSSFSLLQRFSFDLSSDPLTQDFDISESDQVTLDLRERAVRIAQAVPKPAIRSTFDNLMKRADMDERAAPGPRGWVVMNASLQTLVTRGELAESPDTIDALMKGVPKCMGTTIFLSSLPGVKNIIRCKALAAWIQQPRALNMSGSVVDRLTSNLDNWPVGIAPGLKPFLSRLTPRESNRMAFALLKAVEKPVTGESRAPTYQEALEAVLPNVTQERAIDLGRDVLIRTRRSADPVTIGRLSGLAIALAPRLPANNETRSMLLEFMKFPSARLHPLIDALRRTVPEVPPYGTSPAVFLDALARNPSLREIDLDAPAMQKPDDVPDPLDAIRLSGTEGAQ